MKNQNKKLKGFTLVELLIVIAIMGIMLGVSLSFGNSAKQDVDAASQQVIAQLRSLQNDALSGKRILKDGEIVPTKACSYKFSTPSTTSYKVSYYGECDPGPTAVPIVERNVNLKNVTISNSSISFKSPHAIVGNALTITITSSKSSGVTKNINIRTTGIIE